MIVAVVRQKVIRVGEVLARTEMYPFIFVILVRKILKRKNCRKLMESIIARNVLKVRNKWKD